MAQVHVRVEGQSYDLRFADLDVGDLSTDNEIKTAVARFLEVPVAKVNTLALEKTEDGDVTLRPQAVFG